LEPLPPILPVGTAIVVLIDLRASDGRILYPRGTPGVISAAPRDPEHAYRVRLAGTGDGGTEHALLRRQLQVLKVFQTDGMSIDPLGEHALWDHVIYRCIIGSRAYGLDHAASDTDRRGIYLPPATAHWSLYGVPEQLERPETEECYWEYGKFIRLALKANPNVLEVLYSPIVEHTSPLAQPLLAARRCFVSKLIYQTYNAYAMSQFRKMQHDLAAKGSIKWKHAMHLLRLLLSGIEALQTGDVPVLVTRERQRLLDVRHGHMPFDDVEHWRLQLHAEFEQAYLATTLPDRPDYAQANELLIHARTAMVTTAAARNTP
jgi:hypothetical protein